MSHIMVWRGSAQEDGLAGFWHHGIRCPDATVIHYTGMDGVKTLRNAVIARTSLSDFRAQSPHPVHTVEYDPADHPVVYPAHTVVRRAESRLGNASYHLLFHNCESFARWCVVGDTVSFQTQGYLVGVAAGLGSIAVGGGLLGAALTAVVFQKFWDRRANRSHHRTAATPALGESAPDDSDEG